MNIFKKIVRIVFRIIKWTLMAVLVLVSLSAIYNLWLPDASAIKDRLSSSEKACIMEAMQLQQQLGDSVWPGWGDLRIPVIVYNEDYAFLLAYPHPPDGWMKMPQQEFRGFEWEAVPGEDFMGAPYYRQALPDPDITPENFTVKVGERWVATMMTREYAEVKFYNDFKEELPPILKAIFPYGVFWKLIMGTAENYISGMAHEAFHAYQGHAVPQKFAETESATRYYEDYPWNAPENVSGWKEETVQLLNAYHADSHEEAELFTRAFLDRRKGRRLLAQLPDEMSTYEQQREWLEGLAKYAELQIGLVAEQSNDYVAVDALKATKGFRNYETRTKHFSQQMGEVIRTAGRHGESRFYYVGMLQAKMLDRLMPGWKARAFDEGIYLESLLAEAVK